MSGLRGEADRGAAPSPSRIAILAHSTNPRGGVVHAMQLAEALCDAGGDATLIAPDVSGRGFFRPTRCRSLTIPARPEHDTVSMVARRIVEIADFLSAPGMRRFALYHAQDSITANALADLAGRGTIPFYLRTVHHLDQFEDARLAFWQERGMRAARATGVVSALWQRRLRDAHGIAATLLGNGVDTARYTPVPDGREAALRARLALRDSDRVILAMGGIEARKNTLGTLRAVLEMAAGDPSLRLVVAGGATLLDHAAERARFDAMLSASGLAGAVVLAGIVDDADMPSLYRVADVLACPSLEEGFGLCPLEAMACGCPVLVSRIAPFTEHLRSDEAVWVDVHDPDGIRDGLAQALSPGTARRLRRTGPATAARFGWDKVAEVHRSFYALQSKETIDA